MRRESFKDIQSREDGEPSKNMFEKAAKAFLKMWFMGFMFRGNLVMLARR
jgi:hypothetical protein